MAMGNPGWQKGVSGNPLGSAAPGARREKIILSALERAIKQDDKDRIRKGLEKILDLFAAGEEWAIQFVADRCDGKPTQQLDMRVERPIRELSREELLRIAAGSSEGDTVPGPSDGEATQLH